MRREGDEVFEPAASFPRRPWGPEWTASQVIEVLAPLVHERRRQRIEEVLARRVSQVTVLLDSPHDPHNGAAILRSCDAFGVQEAHVVPREQEFLASNIVSKGAERWVDVIQHPTATEAAQTLRAGGYELVSTHPGGELEPEDLAGLQKVALVLGNEHEGICEELTSLAGRSVRIPMIGFVESLNVSVSAAILLRAATQGRPGDLSLERHQTLLAQGLYRSVKRAGEILAAHRG